MPLFGTCKVTLPYTFNQSGPVLKGTEPQIHVPAPSRTAGEQPAWIRTAPGAPYFVTEAGENWTPIGYNDALTWPGLTGLYRRRNLAEVKNYFANIRAQGVTCLRIMMEYSQRDHRYLEWPAGVFQPLLVSLWDDLFALCEAYGIRLLLTPFDSFWMRRRWRRHPYHSANGGPCQKLSGWFGCRATRRAVEERLAFATRRWGGSGVIFAWDLWNEIDPRLAEGSVQEISEWVGGVGTFLRNEELKVHGKAHLQTVSVYGPLLKKYPELNEVVFRHPQLGFASVHFYDEPVRAPKDPVKPALRTGELTRQALEQITDGRPFLDTEHGPDRLFRKMRGRIPTDFDEEYFLNMQWAHLASGGAGGGFRWPYRHPHTLTSGMRAAQQILATWSAELDWSHFERRHLSREVLVLPKHVKALACGNSRQVLLWLVRPEYCPVPKDGSGAVDRTRITLKVSTLQSGIYRIRAWNPQTGKQESDARIIHSGNGEFAVQLPLSHKSLVVLVTRLSGG